MRLQVDNCYQCANYQVCFLRKGIEDLLDDGFHKEVIEGSPVLKDCVPLQFFELLAAKCKIKEKEDNHD